MNLAPATKPTLYFIGVTTSKSSILRVFPAWATELGLENVQIKGIDLPLHADRQAYRDVVSFIKTDPLSMGALVTTHKIDIFNAAKDLFEEWDLFAEKMGEISCISKKDGKLICHAKDPISSGLALDSFISENHWIDTGAALICMGAGGSTIAITWYLANLEKGANRPSRVIVSNRSKPRLDEIERIHTELDFGVPFSYVLAGDVSKNDAQLSALKPGSVVINATGLGKDAPGSPISDAAEFPQNGLAWDLNYRGDLMFLDQSRAQRQAKSLHVEDGWTYFLHGWTQVIAEVFHIDIPTAGPSFERLSKIAKDVGSVKVGART